MKLGSRDAPAYFARPDPKRAGLLIFGADAMRVALRRQEASRALVGPEGEAEMRLTRIAAADLRKDPAQVLDAVKAVGFFPGPRAVVVEDAADGLAEVLSVALEDWRPGDASLIVTAGQLAASSRLRKLFEGHANAYAAAIYDDPPSRAEIEAVLSARGVGRVSSDAMVEIERMAQALDPGDFRQTVEKLALYKYGDTGAVTVEDLAAVRPATVEAAVDEVIDAVADGRTGDIGTLMRRIGAQGVAPVTLVIAATRHFRALLAAASHPGGPSQGVGGLRPPLFGPRRDKVARQAGAWGADRLAAALHLLLDTDLTLRSAARPPEMPLVERALIRLSELGRGRG